MKRLPKLRSIFARKRARGVSDEQQSTYRDIVWENAIEAYESSPDPELEITPYIQARLDAAKQELILKAQRMKREHDQVRWQRRRRAAVVATASASVLVAAGGTAALTGVSTGVPSLDRVLGSYELHDTPEASPAGLAHPKPESAWLNPEAPIVNFEFRWVDGGQQTAPGAAFTSQDGLICYVLPTPQNEQPDENAYGAATCQSPGLITRRVERDGFFLAGVTGGEVIVVSGYARQDVDGLEIVGPLGELYVEITDAWDPGLRDIGRIRVFVGAAVAIGTNRGRDSEALDRAMDLRVYEVRAHMQDGRVLTVPARP